MKGEREGSIEIAGQCRDQGGRVEFGEGGSEVGGGQEVDGKRGRGVSV